MRPKSPGQGILATTLLAAALALAGCSDSPDPGVDTEVATASEDFYPFDTPPVLTTYPTPVYPEKAREAGLEGRVVVRVLVSEEGTVMETSVLESSNEMFTEAAVTAMARCEFEPALKDGKATRAMVAVPVQFALDQGNSGRGPNND